MSMCPEELGEVTHEIQLVWALPRSFRSVNTLPHQSWCFTRLPLSHDPVCIPVPPARPTWGESPIGTTDPARFPPLPEKGR